MEYWNKEDRELCKLLNNKRDPNVGEYWYVQRLAPHTLIPINQFDTAIVTSMNKYYIYVDILAGTIYPEMLTREAFIYPLLTTEEVLIILRGKYWKFKNSANNEDNLFQSYNLKEELLQALFVSDNLKTALLRLVVKITKKKT